MKANYKLNDYITIQVEAEKLSALLEEINSINNALKPEPCGKCGKSEILPRVREVDDNKFYELQCQNSKCMAVLALGVHKESGTLYKKKMKTDNKGKAIKNEDGKAVYLPDNGWLKWDKEKKQMV
tara:strand:+ start:17409 stop:17783 length:375 start_codon:yes stop_codon:yes gene_type:complete